MAATREDVIEMLKGMTALELAEFVHELEEVFGVSAAATAVAAPVEAAPVEEKTEFDVILESSVRAATRTTSLRRPRPRP